MNTQFVFAVRVFDNNLDAFYPEIWAMESLAILEENMVAANLVHRDFENEVAKFGDTVNTRRPSEFVAKRKGVSDDVVNQNATATNVPVVLNQLPHVSFLLRDGEESWAFKDLVNEYLSPAMLAMARLVDQIVLGQYPQFLANQVGSVTTAISSSNTRSRLLDLRNKMNLNKAPMDGRNVIWTPTSETALLNTDIFLQANTSGDGGAAMRTGQFDYKLGFNHFMCQNMASVGSATADKTGAINNASGYAKGATSALVVDGITGTIQGAGQFCTLGGKVYTVVSTTATTGNTTGVTLKEALMDDVADNDAIVFHKGGTVNYGAGYSAGYAKELTVTGPTIPFQTGQAIRIGVTSTSPVYTIVRADSSTSILLDRPLDADVADTTAIFPVPKGEYNLSFLKNAMSLVVRPMAQPRPGTGAVSAVVNHKGLAIRITITYDGVKQGHRVTLDMLCGVKVLDANQGALLLG